VLDVDLSPLPASRHTEGSVRSYMGRCRSKTGRKLVRVRASQYRETVWEEVWSGRTGKVWLSCTRCWSRQSSGRELPGDSTEAQSKRARTEILLDSA
jgi:hypothetical protein